MTFQIDSERIFAAVVESGVKSPKAIELGAELVDAWCESCYEADKRYRTLGLEVGWFIALDERTYVVGAVDRLVTERKTLEDKVVPEPDPFVLEMKTTAARSSYWGPEKWLEELSAGHQVATYAAALKWGTFIMPRVLCNWQQGEHRDGCAEGCESEKEEKMFAVASPRILARAVSKSKPPQVWPDENGSFIEPSPARLDATLNAYRNAAAAIRTQCRTGVVPWQLPGKHCVKVYGRTEYPCSFKADCDNNVYPPGNVMVKPAGLSPGSESVVDHLVATGRIEAGMFDRYVVLSASSLDDYAQCPERHRRRALGAPREAKESLDVGTVFHAGIAEYARQCKEAGY